MKKIILLLCLLLIMGAYQTNKNAVKDISSNEKEGTCYLYVACKNATEDNSELKEESRKILPKDGVIFEKKEVDFYEDDTAYDVLKRELEKEKIPVDSSKTTGLGSEYVRGISGLYEFDCGEQSGWMYTVNGAVENVSVSEYKVQDKDEIAFQYTCNWGKDLKTDSEE